MQKHLQFHGSDLEKIEKIYNIPKEEIVCFASNVNPLGLSEQVKNQLIRQRLDGIGSSDRTPKIKSWRIRL